MLLFCHIRKAGLAASSTCAYGVLYRISGFHCGISYLSRPVEATGQIAPDRMARQEAEAVAMAVRREPPKVSIERDAKSGIRGQLGKCRFSQTPARGPSGQIQPQNQLRLHRQKV